MAFVPDDAMRRRGQLSRSAWDVYAQLCAFGDSETGIVETRYARNTRLAEWTGLKLGTVKNAMTELRKREWIEERGALIYLRVGTFLKVLRERRKRDQKPSPTNDAPSLVSDASSLTSDAPSPTNDAPSLVSDDAYIGSRARSDQPNNQSDNQPENQHTHTSMQSLNAPAVEQEPPAAACVRVDERLSLERLERYARNQSPPLGGGWINRALTAEGLRLMALVAQVESWERRQNFELVTNGSGAMSARDCPDCTSAGMVFKDPSKPGLGVRKCKHPKLSQARADPDLKQEIRAG